MHLFRNSRPIHILMSCFMLLLVLPGVPPASVSCLSTCRDPPQFHSTPDLHTWCSSPVNQLTCHKSLGHAPSSPTCCSTPCGTAWLLNILDNTDAFGFLFQAPNSLFVLQIVLLDACSRHPAYWTAVLCFSPPLLFSPSVSIYRYNCLHGCALTCWPLTTLAPQILFQQFVIINVH